MANSLSQEEINARIEAAKAKRPPREKINNSEVVAAATAEGVRILHVLPTGQYVSHQGMTIAFNHEPNKPVVEVSTALCKRGDIFSRKYGTRTALEHFRDGETVYLPVLKYPRERDGRMAYDAIGTLRYYFG